MREGSCSKCGQVLHCSTRVIRRDQSTTVQFFASCCCGHEFKTPPRSWTSEHLPTEGWCPYCGQMYIVHVEAGEPAGMV